jgi:hypothetical protein
MIFQNFMPFTINQQRSLTLQKAGLYIILKLNMGEWELVQNRVNGVLLLSTTIIP